MVSDGPDTWLDSMPIHGSREIGGSTAQLKLCPQVVVGNEKNARW
jgi:hypothetical protein